MKNRPSLDDLALFAHVASEGGLTAAARRSGVSLPTLSRRMRALETQMGGNLFRKGARGYELTAAGHQLWQELAPLTALEASLARRQTGVPRVDVRITAGGWTSMFLAHSLPQVWSADDAWRPVFVAADLNLDLARREADIGVRNHRPEQRWLAVQRMGTVRYAAFARSPDVTGYIGLSEGAPKPPSARWIETHHARDIALRASTPRLAADLACVGLGRVVLPVFVGPMLPDLRQVTDDIAVLEHEEWLVSHQDMRHDPAIRAGLDACATLLRNRSLRDQEG